MALFNKKKNEPPPKEMKQYITGAVGLLSANQFWKAPQS